MYRNVMSMCRGDRLNLQSDMSCFRATNSIFSGNGVREAVLFMRSMAHHIEKYSSEKLFDENDITFLNATGK